MSGGWFSKLDPSLKKLPLSSSRTIAMPKAWGKFWDIGSSNWTTLWYCYSSSWIFNKNFNCSGSWRIWKPNTSSWYFVRPTRWWSEMESILVIYLHHIFSALDLTDFQIFRSTLGFSQNWPFHPKDTFPECWDFTDCYQAFNRFVSVFST